MLTSRRITLRNPAYEDGTALYSIFADPRTTRFFPSMMPRDEKETRILIAEWHALRTAGLKTYLIVASHDIREVHGCIQVSADQELGIFLSHNKVGLGYATEALATLKKFFLMKSLWSISDAENILFSRFVARSGFKTEKRLVSYRVHPHVSNKPRDCLLFRQKPSRKDEL